MTDFVYPTVPPGGGIPDDGSPSLTLPTPSARDYDATTLAAVRLPALTAVSTGPGPFAVTFTIVTESGGFSVEEDGSFGPTLALTGTLSTINTDLQSVWLKPGPGSQNTIAYTVDIEDTGNGKSGSAGEPLQVTNKSLYTKGEAASTTVTVSGSSGSITLVVEGQPIMASVPFATSLTNTVTNMVTAINGFTGTPKYKGTKVGTNQIKLEASLAYGSSKNGVEISATATGNMSITSGSKLAGGVPEVQPPAGFLDKALDFAKDLAVPATGLIGGMFIGRMLGQGQVEVTVNSTDEVPDVAVLIDLLLVPVPLGYVPAKLNEAGDEWTEAEYPDDWDYITFEAEPKMCWNPALCWLALMKNKRWGAGNSVPLGDTDLMRLHKEIWDIMPRCDEMVKGAIDPDDGSLFMEPRYTINTLIRNMTQKEAIEAVASVCDAQVIYSYDGIHFKPDAPDEPKRVVTNANVGGGKFKWSSGSLNSLYNYVEVGWNNPAKYYAVETVRAVDVTSIQSGIGEKSTSVRAFGCASEGQAKRKARYIMANSQTTPAMVSYVAGFDHYGLLPGDLVMITDNNRQPINSIRAGGRVLEVIDSRTFKLDRELDLGAGLTYLSFSMPDDTVETRVINSTNTVDNITTVTTQTAFSVTPKALWVWTYSYEDVSDILFKIVSTNEKEVGEYEIVAVAHDPTKYDFMDDF